MKYIFVGDGAGVPGLPREISSEEAEAQGVAQLLADAIENGNYVPVIETGAHPDPLPRKARGVKKE